MFQANLHKVASKARAKGKMLQNQEVLAEGRDDR
jgi:hypothetical protein